MSLAERRLWEREIVRQHEKELRAKREKKLKQAEPRRAAPPHSVPRYYRAGAATFSTVFR